MFLSYTLYWQQWTWQNAKLEVHFRKWLKLKHHLLTRGTFDISNTSVIFAQLVSNTGALGIHICCVCGDAEAIIMLLGLHSPHGGHGGEKHVWSLLITHLSLSLHLEVVVRLFLFIAQLSGPHGNWNEDKGKKVIYFQGRDTVKVFCFPS